MGTTAQDGCAALVNRRGAILRRRSCDMYISHEQALIPYFPSMYILIENEETSEYLTETNHWSKNPLKGERFPSGKLAFRAAKLEAIGKFNIVGYIPETNQFINLHRGRGTRKSEEVNEK